LYVNAVPFSSCSKPKGSKALVALKAALNEYRRRIGNEYQVRKRFYPYKESFRGSWREVHTENLVALDQENGVFTMKRCYPFTS